MAGWSRSWFFYLFTYTFNLKNLISTADCYPAARSPSDAGIASLMPISKTPFLLTPITVISQSKYFSGVPAISPTHNVSKVDLEYRQTLSNIYFFISFTVISFSFSPCITRQGRIEITYFYSGKLLLRFPLYICCQDTNMSD